MSSRRAGGGQGRRVRVRLGALLVLAGMLVAGPSSSASAQGSGTVIDVVEVEGIIDQTIADFLRERLAVAADQDVEAVVVQMDTPGGLGVSMQEVVDVITASEVPVVTWVGPSGAQAASAGTYIAYASHVLAVAPATTIGAATPVDLGGDDLAAKAVNSAEARLVALARLRGRSEDFARAAVRDGAVVAVGDAPALPADALLPPGIDRDDVRILTASEAVDEQVVDLVAATLPDVLAALDGREVTVSGDGAPVERTLDVDTTDANVRFNNLGLVRRVLHTVANPTLAYLLLIGGTLALLFEVFQPGFGVAGVCGLVLLGLGLYGLSVLPVSWLALGLLVLGLALLAIDLAVAGLGALTAGGAIAVTVGSFLLFTGPEVLRVSAWVILPVVAFTVAFFVVIMTTVLRAQGTQALVGAESLPGKVGVVRSMLNPEGHVFVDGALWRARAPDGAGRVPTGTKVRVLGMNDRLTLDVELVEEPDSATVG